jgi:hypothetical protein
MSNEDVPEIIPWPVLQKRAERDGVDIMAYVNSLNAHVERQRREINRLRERLTDMTAKAYAALAAVPDGVLCGELQTLREKALTALDVSENNRG